MQKKEKKKWKIKTRTKTKGGRRQNGVRGTHSLLFSKKPTRQREGMRSGILALCLYYNFERGKGQNRGRGNRIKHRAESLKDHDGIIKKDSETLYERMLVFF